MRVALAAMHTTRLAAVSLPLMLALAGASIGRAAGPAVTTWSGVYSTAQATEGESLYLDRCAECHQPDLSGGEDAPALSGAQFSARWNGRPLAQLFTLIRRSMPQNAPGSLTPAEGAALLAHLLERNGFPQGATPLPADASALAAIGFAAERP